MKNKTVLTDTNASRMELILQKLPKPMTAGQIVRYLEQNSNLVPDFIEEEAVCRSTFISRIVNTAKYGKNNKIAIVRKKDGTAKFHQGCGYLLYHDENKINYTSQDVERMRHHAQGKPRPKARKRQNNINLETIRQQNSNFLNFMSDDIKKFETVMKTGLLGDWSNLSMQEKKTTYLNFSAKVAGELKRLISGTMENTQNNFQVIDNDLATYQERP